MKQKILFYKLEEIPNYKKILGILALFKIEFIIIPDKWIHCSIDSLIHSSIKPAKDNKPLKEPMLIFYQFSNQQIDGLLNAFKKADIPFIPLKAVVTPTNIHWSFEYLHEHAKEEYLTITKKK